LKEDRQIHWKSEDANHGPYFGQPEQIHLAYNGSPNRLSVTWVTFDDTETSYIQYGRNGQLNQKVQSRISRFVDGGRKKSVRYIHRVFIKDIKAGERYFYRVGCNFGWSSLFTFVGLKERKEGGYRYAIYGDLGNINARSLGKLQRLSQDGDFDLIFHNGDFAYDMNDKDGKFGDEFMRQIEPAAAYVPYMISVGNHDKAYNYSHIVNRFTMPGTDHNLFYSFDLGQAHIVSFSTEFYYWTEFGSQQIANQWNWLYNDLENANKNRKNVPWIIVFGHRTMYCTDVEGRCDENERRIREGMDVKGSYGLEKLFYSSGVDLIVGAHEHNYERFWPMYNYTIFNGTIGPYIDPPAPTLVVTGSAGCQENVNHFPKKPAKWSAFRSSNYGFSRMQVFNKTHLYFEQVMAAEERVEDSFWLIKNKHSHYTQDDLERLRMFGSYVKPSTYD